MSGNDEAKAPIVAEVREKTEELAKLLDDFCERLRRMRARNRQVEREIVSFGRTSTAWDAG